MIVQYEKMTLEFLVDIGNQTYTAEDPLFCLPGKKCLRFQRKRGLLFTPKVCVLNDIGVLAAYKSVRGPFSNQRTLICPPLPTYVQVPGRIPYILLGARPTFGSWGPYIFMMQGTNGP